MPMNQADQLTGTLDGPSKTITVEPVRPPIPVPPPSIKPEPSREPERQKEPAT